MNRENFIKFIPKPNNEDVILYDISLKDLIDVDVLTEYNQLLPVFKEELSNFSRLKDEIKAYTEIINQIFLLNPSWSEEVYLEKLKDDTRIYSTMYGNIKKREDEIKIYQNKIEAVNDKIIIQKNKEEKENEERYKNIKKDIEEDKLNLQKNKDALDIYKSTFKRTEEQVKELKDELRMLKLTGQQMSKGEFECVCCNQAIPKSNVQELLNKIKIKIQEKTLKLEELLEKSKNIQNTLEYYKNEVSQVKISLQNNMKFRSNYKHLYTKKTIEVLKLEASRNEYLNKIEELNEKLKNEPQINSKRFLELKNRIDKYKVSLENLKKVKEMKEIMNKKINTYKENQPKIREMETLINKYLSFLNIYYKIYEQKASQYAGEDYKIKLFEIQKYDVIKILTITYKGTEYSQLSKKEKGIVDKNLAEKFLADL